ncbi:hypothetical protein R3W88_007822 [Solanum pinnatisectum]|uniref:Endonuclease/exonuclease/phosphatase domain-containing protein n=1 Tax=Solanum pinnatisectum TaxID=50273 RepID=A0AAV9M6X5_9SOLN|nr:hypothetical protein R3W88_007822 [Solanum pinnatisectum]
MNNHNIQNPQLQRVQNHYPQTYSYDPYQFPQMMELPTYIPRHPAFLNLTNPLTPFDQNYSTQNSHLLAIFPHAERLRNNLIRLAGIQLELTQEPTTLEFYHILHYPTSLLNLNLQHLSLIFLLNSFVENATTEVPMVNLEMSLNPGGSSNTQEAISMKILMWNCRGAHNANFMNNLRALLEWNNPCVLALTETRMEDHDRILQSLDFTDVIQVAATRYSGGGGGGLHFFGIA